MGDVQWLTAGSGVVHAVGGITALAHGELFEVTDAAERQVPAVDLSMRK